MSATFVAAMTERAKDSAITDPRAFDAFTPRWLTRDLFGDLRDPLSQVDIELMIEVGDLQPTDRVSHDGGRTWLTLQQAQRLFVESESPRAPSASARIPPPSPRARTVVRAQALGVGTAPTVVDNRLFVPPAGFTHAAGDEGDGWSVSEDELAAEYSAMQEALYCVFAEAGRPAVLPDFREHELYGDLHDPNSLGGKLIDRATAAVNLCAHLLERPHLRRAKNVIFWHFICSAGFFFGRESTVAFQAFSPGACAVAMLQWDPASTTSSTTVVAGVADLILTHVSRAETQNFDSEEQRRRLQELRSEQGEIVRSRLHTFYGNLQMPLFSAVVSLIYLERALSIAPTGVYSTDFYQRQRFFLPATLVALKMTYHLHRRR